MPSASEFLSDVTPAGQPSASEFLRSDVVAPSARVRGSAPSPSIPVSGQRGRGSGSRSSQEVDISTPPEPVTGTSLPSVWEKIGLGSLADQGGSPEQIADLEKSHREREAKFTEENRSPEGVPLDINDTVEPGLRFSLSLKSPADVFKTLEAEGRNPRPSADGQNIVVRSADGKKDVLFYPYGSPDIAGGLPRAAVEGGKLAAATLVGSPEVALAGRGAALATIPASTLISGGSAKQAAAETALAALPPAVLEGVPQIARSFLIHAPDVQSRAIAAAAAPAAERTGIEFSPALVTGNKTLAKSERALGASGAVGDANEAALQESQQRAQERLIAGQSTRQPQGVAMTNPQGRATAQAASVPQAEEIAASAQPPLPSTGLSNADVGQVARKAVVDAKQAFDAKVNPLFNDLYAKANDAGVTVNFSPEAKGLLGQIEERSSPISDILSGDVARVKGKLSQLSEAQPVNLQAAIEARALARDALDSGLLGSVESGYWKQLYSSLDESIQKTVGAGSRAPKDVKNAFTLAQDTYREGIQPLQATTLKRLTNTANTSQGIADDRIIPSLLEGGHANNLNDLKASLGATSPQYEIIRNQTAAHVINEADGDGAKLLSSLGKMDDTLKGELFGADAANLENYATLLKQAQAKGETHIADLAKIYPKLPADLQDSVAQRTAKDLIEGVRVDKPSLVGARFNLDPKKLADIVSGKDRTRYAAVLGPERMAFLDDLLPVAQQIQRVGAMQGKITLEEIAGQVAHGAFTGARDAALLGPGSGLTQAGAKIGALSKLNPISFGVGNAQRFQHVVDFLKTGELPSFVAPITKSVPATIAGAWKALPQQDTRDAASEAQTIP